MKELKRQQITTIENAFKLFKIKIYWETRSKETKYPIKDRNVDWQKRSRKTQKTIKELRKQRLALVKMTVDWETRSMKTKKKQY